MKFELSDRIESYPTDVGSTRNILGNYELPINLYVDIQKYFTSKEWEVVYDILFEIWQSLCLYREDTDYEIQPTDYSYLIEIAENLHTLRHLD